MDNEKIASFPPETIEKVARLLDVLEEIAEHPLLKGRFAMYGGTAINLFMLNIPRLSVDIDSDDEIAKRADLSPEAAWKLSNLKRC